VNRETEAPNYWGGDLRDGGGGGGEGVGFSQKIGASENTPDQARGYVKWGWKWWVAGGGTRVGD